MNLIMLSFSEVDIFKNFSIQRKAIHPTRIDSPAIDGFSIRILKRIRLGRMMSRPMVDAILEIKENNRYMKGIFSYVGFDTKWIGFHDEKRAGGQSKWNFVSLFTYALQAIYSVSDAPFSYV